MIEPEIQAIRERDDLDELRERLMAKPGVHTTAIGYKAVDGEQTDEPALFAYVDEKKPERALSREDIVPAEIEGVTTDVQEAGRGKSLDFGSDTRTETRVRPPCPGINMRREDNYGGSIGMHVEDDTGTGVGFLTCHHVVQPTNTEMATAVYNPSYDSTLLPDHEDRNRIGAPVRWEASTLDDWAYVELDDPAWLSSWQLGLGDVRTIEMPSFTERIVVNSAYQGLVGGVLWSVDIRGDTRADFEYQVDDDISLSGGSGGLTAWYDSSVGAFKAFAMHNSNNTNNTQRKFGNWLGEIFTDAQVSWPTTGATGPPTPPATAAYVEGTVFDVAEDGSTVEARILNAGGTEVTRTVETRNPADATTIDSATVTLGGFEHTTVTLATNGLRTVQLFTGDETWTTELQRFTGDWRLETTFGDYSVDVNGVAVNSDETLVAVALESNFIDIYEYGTWTHVQRLTAAGDVVGISSQEPSVRFSRDGNYVAAGFINGSTTNGKAAVWDISAADPANWTEVAQLNPSGQTGITVRSVDFSPDSRYIAAADSYSSPTGAVWETGTWTKVTNLDTGTFGRSVMFSPDGRYIAMGDSNGDAVVFNVGNPDGTGWGEVARMTTGTATLGGLAWDDAMRWFVTGHWSSTDYEVFIYPVGEPDGTGWGTWTQRFDTPGSVYGPTFSRDAEYFMLPIGAGTPENSIFIFEEGTWHQVERVDVTARTIESAEVSSNRIIVSAREPRVKVYRSDLLRSVPKPENLAITGYS